MKKSESIFWHTDIVGRWKIYASPARPSKGECRLIQTFIGHRKKRPRILILGSTPEYRDLAHNLHAEVTCVDIGLEMLMGMADLMKHKNKVGQEIWLKSDWLVMPVAENYYDFVLGDLVINNLPLNLQSKFFAKIKSLLKPGGYFITRDWWPPTIKEPVGSIVDKILASGINKRSMNIFTWELMNGAYNFTKKIARTADMYQALKKIWRQEKDLSRKKRIATLLKQTLYHYPVGKVWWVKPRRETEREIRRYFAIKDTKFGYDHPCVKQCPIYFLQK